MTDDPLVNALENAKASEQMSSPSTARIPPPLIGIDDYLKYEPSKKEGGVGQMFECIINNPWGLIGERAIRNRLYLAKTGLGMDVQGTPDLEASLEKDFLTGNGICAQIRSVAKARWTRYGGLLLHANEGALAEKEFSDALSLLQSDAGFDGKKVIAKRLKVPRTSNEKDKAEIEMEYLQRFVREHDVMDKVKRHPGIPNSIALLLNTPQGHFLVMEYVDGKNLSEYVAGYSAKNNGALIPPQHALDIAMTVAPILQYCHSHQIYHRDIKPDNIMITNDNKIKVVDLGLCKDLLDPNQTINPQAMGSVAYMAPEQAKPSLGEANAKTDMYGLGGTLFALVAGHARYSTTNLIHTLVEVSMVDKPHLTHLHDTIQNISPRFEAMVDAMMEKDAKKRSTFEEFLAEAAAIKASNDFYKP